VTETNITESTVVLNLELGRIGNRRRLAKDTDSIKTDVDREMLHVAVDLFDAEELRECQNFLYALKARIRGYTVPSFLRGGMYLVKLEGVDQVERILNEAREGFRPLVDAFAAVSDTRREEAKERLGSAYDPAAYPTPDQIRGKYRISWRWLTLNTPSSLKKISKALFDQEKQKAEEQLHSAVEEINKLLAAEAKKLADHLVERLTPDEDGKAKKFRDSSVQNISEFLDTFNIRNIGDNQDLNKQVERMRKLLNGVSPDDLRKSDQLREDVAGKFSEMSKQLDLLIVDKPARFLDLRRKTA